MANVQLIVDSSCDLPEPFFSKINPLLSFQILTIGGQVFSDRKDIDTATLLSLCKKENALPTTSALSVNDLIELFKKVLATAEHIYFQTCSRDISPLYENALFARTSLHADDKITILDSGNISAGSALLLLALAKDIKEGRTPGEIERRFNQRKTNVRFSFVIDRMDFMDNGGRCQGLTFLLGSKFRLHPIIEIEDGKMAVRKLIAKKNADKAIDDIVRDFKAEFEKGNVDLTFPIFVPHAGHASGAKRFCHALESVVGEKILFPVEVSPSVLSHCGPNATGLAYMVRNKN